MSDVFQPSFAAGELSPALSGRIDLAKYQSGLETCRNFLVQAYGGVANRPGTIYVCEGNNHSVPDFLMPFRWGDDQNYVLVLGNRTMKIIYKGAEVKDNAGNVLRVSTPWRSTDTFDLHWAQSADIVTVVHPKYPPYQIKRYAHNHWVIERYEPTNGPFEDVNIDVTKLFCASASEGDITVTANFDAFGTSDVGRYIYFEIQDWGDYKSWQSGREVNLGDFVVSNSKIYKAVELSGASDNKKTKTGGTAPDHDEGYAWDGTGWADDGSSDTYYGVKWQFICSAIGIARITSVTNSRSVSASVTKTIAVANPGGTFAPMTVEAASCNYNSSSITYKGIKYTRWVEVHITRHSLVSGQSVTLSGAGWSKTDRGTGNGTGIVYVVDANRFYLLNVFATEAYTYTVDEGGDSGGVLTGTAYRASTWSGGGAISQTGNTGGISSTYKWAMSAWCEKNGYPSAVGYFQQRMIFAGSTQYPQTVWMTKTGSYYDFGVELPSTDEDAITLTIAASQVNPVRHILSLRSLLLMTSTSEWSIANSDNAVTAATINMQVQSYRGSSNLPPLAVGNMALVVQAKGRSVRDVGYDWSSDSFTGNDLCVLADHLFIGKKIRDWDFAQSPFSIAWCVRSDGVLLGLTYMREHEVFAWHRHDTQGKFESVCVIDEDEEDRTYFEVCRTINGQTRRYIEYFAPRDGVSLEDSVFLDSALSYSGAPAVTLSGLSHLEGMTVGVLADGSVHPDCIVKNGSITLNHSASLVRVGLRYQSELKTLRLSGADGSLFGKKTLIRSVRILTRDSRGLWAGSDWEHLFELKQRSTEPYGSPIALASGWFDIGIAASWTKEAQLCIRQSDPLPASILSIMPDAEVTR
jgi:hypothetical protein